MPSTLPGLIDRARMHLELAKTSAEVFEAHKAAQAARHLAKLIYASNEAQAECLRLVLQAQLRMAGEVRDGQDRGEIAGWGGDRGNQHTGGKIRTSDLAKLLGLEDIGVDPRRLHEWRLLAAVGFDWIERQICLALLAGRAPTYEELLRNARGRAKGEVAAKHDNRYSLDARSPGILKEDNSAGTESNQKVTLKDVNLNSRRFAEWRMVDELLRGRVRGEVATNRDNQHSVGARTPGTLAPARVWGNAAAM